MIKKNKYYILEVKHKKFQSLSEILFYDCFDVFFEYYKKFNNENWYFKYRLLDNISFEDYLNFKKTELDILEIELPEYIDSKSLLDKYLKEYLK